MRSGADECAVKERGIRTCDGRDDVGIRRGFVRGDVRRAEGAVCRLHLPRERRGLIAAAPYDLHPLDRPHREDGFNLLECLSAGAVDCKDAAVLAREQPCRRTGERARAQAGEVRPVEQGAHRARLRVEQHHCRRRRRQAALRVFREARDDLHTQRARWGGVAVHVQAAARPLGDGDCRAQRNVTHPGGVETQRFARGVDGLRHGTGAVDVRFAQNQNVHASSFCPCGRFALYFPWTSKTSRMPSISSPNTSRASGGSCMRRRVQYASWRMHSHASSVMWKLRV